MRPAGAFVQLTRECPTAACQHPPGTPTIVVPSSRLDFKAVGQVPRPRLPIRKSWRDRMLEEGRRACAGR